MLEALSHALNPLVPSSIPIAQSIKAGPEYLRTGNHKHVRTSCVCVYIAFIDRRQRKGRGHFTLKRQIVVNSLQDMCL